MPDQFLDLVKAAAGHELMGPTSLVASSATGGSTTTLVDTNQFITSANDQTWKNRWVYFWSGSNAGQERFASSVAGDTGTLTWVNALSNAVVSGDEYLLLRDFRFFEWARFANETAKSLHYELGIYQRGLTNQYRYSLPTPISDQSWIMDVFRGSYPFQFSSPLEQGIRWYRVDPRFQNVEQIIYLALEGTIGPNEQLYFLCAVPYQHPHMSAFTMSRSVLTPFGESVAVSVPRQWMVMGMVWRALVEKERNLTGDAKAIWRSNRLEASRRYAELCAANGVRRLGLSMSYAESW